jgi:hypothetical protein
LLCAERRKMLWQLFLGRALLEGTSLERRVTTDVSPAPVREEPDSLYLVDRSRAYSYLEAIESVAFFAETAVSAAMHLAAIDSESKGLRRSTRTRSSVSPTFLLVGLQYDRHTVVILLQQELVVDALEREAA